MHIDMSTRHYRKPFLGPFGLNKFQLFFWSEKAINFPGLKSNQFFFAPKTSTFFGLQQYFWPKNKSNHIFYPKNNQLFG